MSFIGRLSFIQRLSDTVEPPSTGNYPLVLLNTGLGSSPIIASLIRAWSLLYGSLRGANSALNCHLPQKAGLTQGYITMYIIVHMYVINDSNWN